MKEKIEQIKAKYPLLWVIFLGLVFLKDSLDWIGFFKNISTFLSDLFTDINVRNIMQNHGFVVLIDILMVYLFYSLEKSIKTFKKTQALLNKFQAIKISRAGIGQSGGSPDNYLYCLHDDFTQKEIDSLVALGALPTDYDRHEKYLLRAKNNEA